MTQLLNLDPFVDQNPTNRVQSTGPTSVVLQMSGGKPLRLTGDLIAECSSWTKNAPCWHDLSVYQRDGGDIVVGLRCCRGHSGEQDIFQARSFLSIETAMTWLLDYDPTADLAVEIDVSDRRISAAEIALRAAVLRQRTDRLQMQYHSMIGELLYQLDLRD